MQRFSVGSAFAAEKDDVIAAVHQYLANLDKPETMCDSQVIAPGTDARVP
jgi:hypothetical protein